jgi:uncharacterized protein (DUF924 family)
MDHMTNDQTIIDFWFDEIDPASWWRKDTEFDDMIRRRFAAVHRAATAGELSEWRDRPQGRLAEIIVLDQFSRNLYRDDPRAFSCDGMALVLAQETVRGGYDRELYPPMRTFVYMPYMHSESAVLHEQAVKLFDQPGMESNLDFEYRHKSIIDRFGRYPHRNQVLGRTSTAEELAFLQQPGSSF